MRESFPDFENRKANDSMQLSTDIGKKVVLFAKLQPDEARKRINATYEAPFSRALHIQYLCQVMSEI